MAYSDKVLDHYENPRNVGKMDVEKKNVGTGMVGAPACGDVMRLQIQVDDDGVIDLLDGDPNDPNAPNPVINLLNVGLCAHRFDVETGEWDFSEGYNLLTNGLSGFDKTSAYNPSEHRYVVARTTLDSWMDNNDDG